jgi:D-serine dehydratase
LIPATESYLNLAEPKARKVFSQYELSVGSTGNLGMSIGIMGSALGFAVTVHMSREARQWKKDRLRALGVRVVEHATDYTAACVEARKIAAGNPRNHFIDDENSVDLFLGYSVAALRTADQLRQAGFAPDGDHPLFVHLPCGVGGAPGGITFGLKQVFGPGVHCFFAEPTGAPCMTLGMMTGRHAAISIYDEGIGLTTQADGLAVSRPSQFVGRLMESLLAGCYTVTDERMYRCVADLYESENLKVELSAAAGCAGPEMVLSTPAGREYLRRHGLESKLRQAAHVIWTTGGRFLPSEEFQKLLAQAAK